MAAALDAVWPADAPLSGLVVTRYDSVPPALPGGAGARRDPDRGRAGGASGARRSRPSRRGANPRARPRPLGRRSRRLPDVGRRVVVARLARRRPDLRREAGDQRRAAEERRGDRRDELRAQAPLGDQGRPARGGMRAGARRDAAGERRSRRFAVGDRQRPDGARSDHLRRRARGAGASRHRGRSCHPRRPRERQPRDAQAGRSGLCRQRGSSGRHAAAVARCRGRARTQCRHRGARAQRRDRGRVARGRQGPRRARAADRASSVSRSPGRASFSQAARRR